MTRMEILVVAILLRSSLSEVCSSLLRVIREEQDNSDFNEAFDGGEWSGPLGWRSFGRKCYEIVRKGGWTPEALEEEVERRTSPKWLHCSSLAMAFAAMADRDLKIIPS